MAYSRWMGSPWYTFWSCEGPETENRDTAVFCVCSVKSFTAKELRDDIDGCIEKVKQVLEEETDYSEEEFDELKGYMKAFLKDVDEEYPEGV